MKWVHKCVTDHVEISFVHVCYVVGGMSDSCERTIQKYRNIPLWFLWDMTHLDFCVYAIFFSCVFSFILVFTLLSPFFRLNIEMMIGTDYDAKWENIRKERGASHEIGEKSILKKWSNSYRPFRLRIRSNAVYAQHINISKVLECRFSSWY